MKKKWVMYLRKSRADNPDESVEEVLTKHEIMLQEYALRELGHKIPEEDIYREVVSGESIDDRIEIKKVLSRIEDPDVCGVIVVEPQRLSRGDLEDCGRLINDLRYSNTLVATLTMTYDLNNKMERKFFQDELLRGNDYLEYYKEILARGRVAAAKRGCYIGSKPPYGYNKIKIGKDPTLEPNENADVVRWIFDMYVREGLGMGAICHRLDDRGIMTTTGKPYWHKETIDFILRNIHYLGKIKYGQRKHVTVMENGVRRKKLVIQPDEEVIIAEGKHPAIISKETWDAAQAKLSVPYPHVKRGSELVNPFAGLVYCPKCGSTMNRNTYKDRHGRTYVYVECRKRPRCSRRIQYDRYCAAILYALENAELPALEAKLANGDGEAAAIQRKLLEKLEKQLVEYRKQEENQYDLLETGKYTPEVFERRNAALRKKMEDCQKQIYETRTNLPEEVNFEERIVTLKEAIAALKDPEATPAQANRLLKSIIKVIYCTVAEDGHEWGKTKFSLDIHLKL